MSKLSDSQLDALRQQLDARETVLQEEVRAVGDANIDGAGSLDTEVEDAVAIGQNRVQTGMAHVDKQRDQEELIAIQAARGRMADGSYGECVDCARSIPFERLEAHPTAVRCVPCQEAYEKTHPAAPLFSV